MVVTSRSPYTVSASVRGIGVAVMWRTCGARPARSARRTSSSRCSHAEAMLLVDDEQAERRGRRRPPAAARACRSTRAASPEARRAERLTALALAQRRGEQLDRREAGQQPRRRLGVLRRERLGRRHDAPPAGRTRRRAACSRARRRSCPSPTSPCRRRRMGACPRDVALDLADRRLLVRRQRRTEAPRRKRAAERAGRRERGRDDPLLLAPLVQQQADLHEQQLLEHEAGARPARLLGRARQVHGQRRVGARRQALAHAQAPAAAGRRGAASRCDLAHHGAQQARGDLLARRVDRHDALGVQRVPFLVVRGSRGCARGRSRDRIGAGRCPARSAASPARAPASGSPG